MRRKLFFAGEFGNALEPAGIVIIAEAAGGIFQVGLEMENGFAVFGVALASEFGEIFAERGTIAGDDGGENVIVELVEEALITGQMAAIEQGDIELGIFALKFGALGERARGGTDAHAHIPESLAEFAGGGFDALFGGGIGAEEEEIDVGVREKFAAAVTAEG